MRGTMQKQATAALSDALCNAEARNSASADSVAWQRKGVPLRIVKSQGPMEHTLTDLVALAKVLYQEEQKAFHAAMAEDTDRSVSKLLLKRWILGMSPVLDCSSARQVGLACWKLGCLCAVAGLTGECSQ